MTFKPGITPLDIQNKEFSKGLRGYKEEEVDKFLDELSEVVSQMISEIERLEKENDYLRSRIQTTQKKSELEASTSDFLSLIQKKVEEAKLQVEKEVELKRIKSEEECRAMIQRTKEEHTKLFADIERIRQEKRRELKNLEEFISRLQTLVNREIQNMERESSVSQ
ncbi:DivIVA domain protein [Thermodesulfobium narugense DSM 14796]|uniref:DivIVA domain protein n=1 Tax=Thermodesulfobium narugense DSM 14796 TaxID=747365 RepID=M1E7E8_9BACT|nr:DivIVA domain-containing protein [Thermodesulfobium narugense]AEE14435.1 DivIVA domain protein [Thermodesulfobium narugense DSM 14796]